MKALAISHLFNMSSDEIGALFKSVEKKPACQHVLKLLNDSKSVAKILLLTDSLDVSKKLAAFKLKKLHVVCIQTSAGEYFSQLDIQNILTDQLNEKEFHNLLPLHFHLVSEPIQYTTPKKINKVKLPKILLSDVDGVLTDAGMYYSENGDELKKFSTYDGMGFKLLQAQGIKVGILTAENRNLNRNRAKKLKLDFDFHGIENKYEVLLKLIKDLNLSLSDVAYVGDDINDLEVLKNVGHPFCPANAVSEISSISGIKKLKSFGGTGVIREIYRFYFSK